MSAWGIALGTEDTTHAYFASHPAKHASHLQARRVGPMSAWGIALGTENIAITGSCTVNIQSEFSAENFRQTAV
jgi:hypothetical protein